MILKCENCGFEKEVTEHEYMESLECPLCGKLMRHISTYNYNSNINKKDKNPIETDRTDILIENKAIEQMKRDIEAIGNYATWDAIESMAGATLRIRYRYYFFKAGGQVPEKGLHNG